MSGRKNSLLDDMASGQPQGPPKSKRIPMIVDLAFATNVRFLDEHELHLDDVQLYKVRDNSIRIHDFLGGGSTQCHTDFIYLHFETLYVVLFEVKSFA